MYTRSDLSGLASSSEDLGNMKVNSLKPSGKRMIVEIREFPDRDTLKDLL